MTLTRISEKEWECQKEEKRLIVDFNNSTERFDVKLYHKGIIKYISNYQDEEDAIKTAQEYANELNDGEKNGK